MKKANKNINQEESTTTAVLHFDDAFRNDLKNSFLLVSVAVNLTILVTYLVLQSTAVFDHQIVTLLLTR